MEVKENGHTVVYSQKSCKYCKDAIDALEAKGMDYSVVDLNKDPAALEWVLAQGARTVPRIYRWWAGEQQLIGGYEDLLESFKLRGNL